HRQEVDRQRHVDGADEVGHEDERAVQHGDQVQGLALVVAPDLLAELGDAPGDVRLRDLDDAGTRLEVALFRHGLLRDCWWGRPRPDRADHTSGRRAVSAATSSGVSSLYSPGPRPPSSSEATRVRTSRTTSCPTAAIMRRS